MKPERISQISSKYAEKHNEYPHLTTMEVIAEAIKEALEEETERFKGMESIFTQITDYLGVEQGNVPGLLEAIQGMKELYEASDSLITHIGAYGCVESDNEFVLKVLGCLNKIDNG